MYKIDKDIPIPERVKKEPKKKSLYPFQDMEVTDSFLVKRPPKKTYVQLRSRITSAQTTFHKRYDPGRKKKFVIRIVPSEKGIRVWRVK